MDTELFDLCKEVYKRFPEWNNTDIRFGNGDMSWIKRKGADMKTTDIPLYTSDYILEKLVIANLKTELGIKQVHLIKEDDGNYRAFCPYVTNVGYADTPLKALLKLVIVLDDINQLPKSPKEDPLQGGK